MVGDAELNEPLKAPFPWFGGKRRVADVVWQRFGDTPNYVEPFFGSGAVLLGRPHAAGIETVNDKDGFVVNAWRAIQSDPDATAAYASSPVMELDLTARHLWLVQQRDVLRCRLEADPLYYDPKVAGWWIWGICAWIGGGWCSGDGPWVAQDGVLVNRKLPHLGDAGRGVNRKLPHLSGAGQGITEYFQQLSDRLRRVRICSGDWSRVLGESPTVKFGTTAVFLDPPYAVEDRADCYNEESRDVAHDVRAWCLENGGNPLLRIALCGYDEHEEMAQAGWNPYRWSASGGYANQGDHSEVNRHREVIWFSPHCLQPDQPQQATLFADDD